VDEHVTKLGLSSTMVLDQWRRRCRACGKAKRHCFEVNICWTKAALFSLSPSYSCNFQCC